MKRPLVTIVTLTYKKFDSIFETILSVLNQKYENIEYIIADDGSPNFPYEKIANFVEKNSRENLKNFEILTKEKNEGTVKNINKAYKKANGEILIPLAADDLFYDNTVIDKIVDKFLVGEIDVLVTSRCFISEDGREIGISPSSNEKKRIFKYKNNRDQHKAFITSTFYNMASGSALYIKKDFLDRWGYFDESYVLWEDGPFLTQYTHDNYLNADYSIVSIKYRLGGVSNGSKNPLMRFDRIHYNETDRVKYLSEYDFFSRRQVNYIIKRYVLSKKKDIIILYLKYMDVIIYKLIRKLTIL